MKLTLLAIPVLLCGCVGSAPGPAGGSFSAPIIARHAGEKPALERTAAGRRVVLHLGPELSSRDTASYYQISHSRQHRAETGSSDWPIFIASNVAKEDYAGRGARITPKVFFSPSGETILIDEDVSESGPSYRFILVYFDTRRDYDRDIAMPSKPSPIYPIRPEIVSITDERVFFRFPGEKKTRSLAFKDAKDDVR